MGVSHSAPHGLTALAIAADDQSPLTKVKKTAEEYLPSTAAKVEGLREDGWQWKQIAVHLNFQGYNDASTTDEHRKRIGAPPVPSLHAS